MPRGSPSTIRYTSSDGSRDHSECLWTVDLAGAWAVPSCSSQHVVAMRWPFVTAGRTTASFASNTTVSNLAHHVGVCNGEPADRGGSDVCFEFHTEWTQCADAPHKHMIFTGASARRTLCQRRHEPSSCMDAPLLHSVPFGFKFLANFRSFWVLGFLSVAFVRLARSRGKFSIALTSQLEKSKSLVFFFDAKACCTRGRLQR